MPVDLLIRSQLWPKERLQSYKSKRAKILKDFTDSKFFTILILNKIIKSILCKFCLQRMLHQMHSSLVPVVHFFAEMVSCAREKQRKSVSDFHWLCL